MSPITTETYWIKEIIELVPSPMYDHSMQLANNTSENEKLYGWNDEHSTVVKVIRKAQEKTEHFKDHQGFTGQAGDVMSAEAVRAFNRFNGQANLYLIGMSYYVKARRAIILAAEEARQLSPTLLDPIIRAMHDVAMVTIPAASNFGLPGQFVDSLAVAGVAYVNVVEVQTNTQREVKSTEVIEHLEPTVNNLSSKLQGHTDAGPSLSGRGDWTPIPEIPRNSVDALEKGYTTTSLYEGGAYGRSRSDAFGNAGLRGSDSGLYPGGYDNDEGINQRVMQSPRAPSRYFPEGKVGSCVNLITDLQDLIDMDLLHMRVNGNRHANGVIGERTLAPPIDRDHSLWGSNASRAAESQTAGRLSGIGAMRAGVLDPRGAIRMGSVSMGAMGRMEGVGAGSFGTSGAGTLGRGSVVAGSSAPRAGVYSGAGMSAYTSPGSGRSTEVAARQGTAAGQRSGFMGTSGVGAGGVKEDKKQRRRRCEAFRIEDEDDDALPRGYVNPLPQTYGTDKDIVPARRRDDGWDPNQW